jgi:hypothetical protein
MEQFKKLINIHEIIDPEYENMMILILWNGKTKI